MGKRRSRERDQEPHSSSGDEADTKQSERNSSKAKKAMRKAGLDSSSSSEDSSSSSSSSSSRNSNHSSILSPGKKQFKTGRKARHSPPEALEKRSKQPPAKPAEELQEQRSKWDSPEHSGSHRNSTRQQRRHSRSRSRDRGERERDRDRERGERDRDRERNRDRDRDRERERERDNRMQRAGLERERERERDGERSKERRGQRSPAQRQRSRSNERKDRERERQRRSPERRPVRRSRSRSPRDRNHRGGRDFGQGRQRNQRRDNRNRNEDEQFEWGKQGDDKAPPEDEEPVEKEKPNFGLSGALTEDTNKVNGVVVKYSEPPEARKPKRRWRLYPFKGETALPTLHIHRQSCFLVGRDRKVVDLAVDHPSCSKQHAALQYRLVPFERDDGSHGKRVRLYLIDLESANGTFLNNKKIDGRKYYELMEKDVIKFGFSSREYVLLHENSKEDQEDDDVHIKDEPLDAPAEVANP
ncbi:FHA domain-containing protein DDL [Drosophila elegans]|uniref:FHA domain-containing protein DDL n=1 Tax=Drosophila elegans TaxID=30023 RepID=UPI0007E886E0|nr:FHA domain-containing protein DDL [Drosophila elegans]